MRWWEDGGRVVGECVTFSLLENALDGAGAAATGHCDVEFVGVCGHGVCCFRRGVVVVWWLCWCRLESKVGSVSRSLVDF